LNRSSLYRNHMATAVKMADVVISRANRYHPNFEDLVLSLLRAKYEKKCFKGAYIESITGLERRLPEFVGSQTSLNGELLGSVYFRAAVVKYEIYDPIVCVVGADISQDGIKLTCCENANAHIYIENMPAGLHVEKGMKIVVRRADSIIYPEGHSHIRTSAMPLCHMNTVVPPRYVYAMTLSRDDVELAKAKYAEIIAPLSGMMADLEKGETFPFFFDMLKDSHGEEEKGSRFDIASLKKGKVCLRYTGKFYGAQFEAEYVAKAAVKDAVPVIGADTLLLMFVEHAKNMKLLELLCSNFPTMADVGKSKAVWKYYIVGKNTATI
jgi:hypothetical protein